MAGPPISPFSAAAAASTQVEIPELRTLDSKTFRVDERTLRTKIYAGPIHYRSSDGALLDIDTALQPTKGSKYAWKNAGGPFTVKLARRARESKLMGFTKDDVRVTLGMREAKGATLGRVRGSSLTYRGIRPGMDLRTKVRRGDVSHRIVLREPPSTAETLRFPLTTGGLEAGATQSGEIALSDATGERLILTRPWLTDSSAHATSGDAASSESLVFAVETTSTGKEIVLSPDPAWLQDPQRVYPIRIDFSLRSPDRDGDTFVQNTLLYPHDDETSLRSGTWDQGFNTARSFLGFDVSSLGDAHVFDADISLKVTHASSCQSADVELRPVLAGWDRTLTWATQPKAGPAIDVVGARGGYSSACPGDRLRFDATSLVRSWTSGSTANHGVQIRAADELDPHSWRKFASDENGRPPVLTIDYNTPPAVPVAISPLKSTITATTSPRLSARYVDADPGDVGRARFVVRRAEHEKPLFAVWGSPALPGEMSYWQVPEGILWPGIRYTMKVSASDGTHTSAPSAVRWFDVVEARRGLHECDLHDVACGYARGTVFAPCVPLHGCASPPPPDPCDDPGTFCTPATSSDEPIAVSSVGDILVVDANLRLSYCHPSCKQTKPDQPTDQRITQFARRIVTLARKQPSASGDGMGKLPDVLLLQEVWWSTPKDPDAVLKTFNDPQRVADALTAETGSLYKVAVADRKQHAFVDTANPFVFPDTPDTTIHRKYVGETAVLYRARSMRLADHPTPTGRIVSRWDPRAADGTRLMAPCSGTITSAKDSGTASATLRGDTPPVRTIPAMMDADSDGHSDCTIAQQKRHVYALLTSKADGTSFAVASVHLSRNIFFATQGIAKTLKERWVGEIRQRLEARYGDDASVFVIAGDMNQKRCDEVPADDTYPEKVVCPDRDDLAHDGLNPFWSDLIRAGYRDAAFTAHNGSDDDLRTQYYDGRDPATGKKAVGKHRIDMIFSKDAIVEGASKDQTCGEIDAGNCDVVDPVTGLPASSERYSDHRLVWSLLNP